MFVDEFWRMSDILLIGNVNLLVAAANCFVWGDRGVKWGEGYLRLAPFGTTPRGVEPPYLIPYKNKRNLLTTVTWTLPASLWSYPDSPMTGRAIPSTINRREWVSANRAWNYLRDHWRRGWIQCWTYSRYNGSPTGPGEDED